MAARLRLASREGWLLRSVAWQCFPGGRSTRTIRERVVRGSGIGATWGCAAHCREFAQPMWKVSRLARRCSKVGGGSARSFMIVSLSLLSGSPFGGACIAQHAHVPGTGGYVFALCWVLAFAGLGFSSAWRIARFDCPGSCSGLAMGLSAHCVDSRGRIVHPAGGMEALVECLGMSFACDHAHLWCWQALAWLFIALLRQRLPLRGSSAGSKVHIDAVVFDMSRDGIRLFWSRWAVCDIICLDGGKRKAVGKWVSDSIAGWEEFFTNLGRPGHVLRSKPYLRPQGRCWHRRRASVALPKRKQLRNYRLADPLLLGCLAASRPVQGSEGARVVEELLAGHRRWLGVEVVDGRSGSFDWRCPLARVSPGDPSSRLWCRRLGTAVRGRLTGEQPNLRVGPSGEGQLRAVGAQHESPRALGDEGAGCEGSELVGDSGDCQRTDMQARSARQDWPLDAMV